MKPPPLPDPELRRLVDLCLDGLLDDISRCHLEQRLQTEPESLAYYLDLASTEALLAPALTDEMAVERFASSHHLQPRRATWRGRVTAMAAAIALLGAVAALWTGAALRKPGAGQTADAPPANAVPARITGAVGARMADARSLPLDSRPSDPLIELQAGVLEITFDQGATLVLEGPAKLEVTGPNSCTLARGRAVAKVPPQAQGFTLAYQDGRLVDHGTEFAINVDEDGKASEMGVFRGEVEIFAKQGPKGVPLFTDYAVKQTPGGLVSTAFERASYTRELPSREFGWDMTDTALDALKEIRRDITPLVRGPGDFRVVFRHLAGYDGIAIRHVEISRDGVVVASSDATGHTGNHIPGRFNDYPLTIPPAAWAPGRWELTFRAQSLSDGMPPRRSTSQGIVSLEEGLAIHSEAGDFLGCWTYSHGGFTYTRIFHPDGSCTLERDGNPVPPAQFSGKWTFDNGVLTVTFAAGNPPEKHMLRDLNTLVFLSNPYRNAHRITISGK